MTFLETIRAEVSAMMDQRFNEFGSLSDMASQFEDIAASLRMIVEYRFLTRQIEEKTAAGCGHKRESDRLDMIAWSLSIRGIDSDTGEISNRT